MSILGLKTDSAICEIWLDDEIFRWEAGRELAQKLLGKIIEVTPLSEISGVVVFRGGGSFTGLRIGITVANSLADALGVPIVGETGEDWREKATEKLARKVDEKVVLPFYDREANITKPKK
ncbi:MAG: hypothetical protein LBM97_02015 [Candidatus Nomurabacteria bacterium]|nr:hypothetical protein [Candidatus Nomurabacteria bacterium]